MELGVELRVRVRSGLALWLRRQTPGMFGVVVTLYLVLTSPMVGGLVFIPPHLPAFLLGEYAFIVSKCQDLLGDCRWPDWRPCSIYNPMCSKKVTRLPQTILALLAAPTISGPVRWGRRLEHCPEDTPGIPWLWKATAYG